MQKTKFLLVIKHLHSNGLKNLFNIYNTIISAGFFPLTILDHDIGSVFAKNKVIVTIFFDIEKAYDTAWRRNILVAT